MTTRGIYPADGGIAVTKSDATILPATRGLWVGGAGDVAVRFRVGGQTVTLVAVPAGTLLPVCVDKVMAANTTASNIVALY